MIKYRENQIKRKEYLRPDQQKGEHQPASQKERQCRKLIRPENEASRNAPEKAKAGEEFCTAEDGWGRQSRNSGWSKKRTPGWKSHRRPNRSSSAYGRLAPRRPTIPERRSRTGRHTCASRTSAATCQFSRRRGRPSQGNSPATLGRRPTACRRPSHDQLIAQNDRARIDPSQPCKGKPARVNRNLRGCSRSTLSIGAN